jgi:hypothetical protein
MNAFFYFMISLMCIRIVYHLIIVLNPIHSIFDIHQPNVFNTALLIPYTTEVVFNLVIFYFNFLLPDQEDRANAAKGDMLLGDAATQQDDGGTVFEGGLPGEL